MATLTLATLMVRFMKRPLLTASRSLGGHLLGEGEGTGEERRWPRVSGIYLSLPFQLASKVWELIQQVAASRAQQQWIPLSVNAVASIRSCMLSPPNSTSYEVYPDAPLPSCAPLRACLVPACLVSLVCLTLPIKFRPVRTGCNSTAGTMQVQYAPNTRMGSLSTSYIYTYARWLF